MSTLLIGIFFGIVFALFANQNNFGIPITIGNLQIQNIPAYLLILGALLIGIVVSWLISLVDTVASTMALRGKEHQIKEYSTQMEQLKEKIQHLEIENASFKNVTPTIQQPHYYVEEQPLPQPKPSFFDRLRSNLSFSH